MVRSKLLVEEVKTVYGYAGTLAADAADWVCLKNYRKCGIVIQVLNGTSVTGSVITLKQASAVAGTGEKALAFTKMLANTDCAASDTLVETAVAVRDRRGCIGFRCGQWVRLSPAW